MVAGGRVIDPAPPRKGEPLRLSARVSPDLDSEGAASHLLRIRRTERIERLVAHTGATPSAAKVFGETAISLEEHDRLHGLAVATVAEFHRRIGLEEVTR